MPDDFGRFQKELAALREQMKREFSEYRAQVAAALEAGGEAGVLRLRVAEWEHRQKELGEKIAAKTVEYQALRARTELDNHRLQMRLGDLEKLLALREGEIAKLKPVLERLAAECVQRQPVSDVKPVAEFAQRPPVSDVEPVAEFVQRPPVSDVEPVAEFAQHPASADVELIAELRGQVTSAREECRQLRLSMDNSLALKAARLIGRLLGMGARQ